MFVYESAYACRFDWIARVTSAHTSLLQIYNSCAFGDTLKGVLSSEDFLRVPLDRVI